MKIPKTVWQSIWDPGIIPLTDLKSCRLAGVVPLRGLFFVVWRKNVFWKYAFHQTVQTVICFLPHFRRLRPGDPVRFRSLSGMGRHDAFACDQISESLSLPSDRCNPIGDAPLTDLAAAERYSNICIYSTYHNTPTVVNNFIYYLLRCFS